MQYTPKYILYTTELHNFVYYVGYMFTVCYVNPGKVLMQCTHNIHKETQALSPRCY